jgi:hypothetical protein
MKNESHAEVVGWPPKKTGKTTIAEPKGECEFVSLCAIRAEQIRDAA